MVFLTLAADHFLQGGYLRRQMVFEAHHFGSSMQRHAGNVVRFISR